MSNTEETVKKLKSLCLEYKHHLENELKKSINLKPKALSFFANPKTDIPKMSLDDMKEALSDKEYQTLKKHIKDKGIDEGKPLSLSFVNIMSIYIPKEEREKPSYVLGAKKAALVSSLIKILEKKDNNEGKIEDFEEYLKRNHQIKIKEKMTDRSTIDILTSRRQNPAGRNFIKKLFQILAEFFTKTHGKKITDSMRAAIDKNKSDDEKEKYSPKPRKF